MNWRGLCLMVLLLIVQPVLASDGVEEIEKKNPKQAVFEMVEAWRAAWSAQNIELYFSFYAKDFQLPARFSSIEAWQQYKRRVIANKKFIDVQLKDIDVVMDIDATIARVQFMQYFRSDTVQGDDVKVLEMEKFGDVWKIVREESIS